MTYSSESWNGADGVGVHGSMEFGAWCLLCDGECLPEKLCMCCGWEENRKVKKAKERSKTMTEETFYPEDHRWTFVGYYKYIFPFCTMDEPRYSVGIGGNPENMMWDQITVMAPSRWYGKIGRIKMRVATAKEYLTEALWYFGRASQEETDEYAGMISCLLQKVLDYLDESELDLERSKDGN